MRRRTRHGAAAAGVVAALVLAATGAAAGAVVVADPASCTGGETSTVCTVPHETVTSSPSPSPSPTATSTTTTTTEPTPHKVTVLGRSGLPWNAGVFYANGDVNKATEFGNWRNRPVDSILFFPSRATWSEMMWMRSDLAAFGGYRIVSLPTQPTSMDNSSTAAGNNNAWWRGYGQQLTDKGWNDGRTILRLNWEGNGSWNPYAFDKPSPTAFVNAIKNVVASVKTTAPKTIFSLAVNKDSKISGVDVYKDIFDHLKAEIDLFNLDWYDHGPAQTTDTAFNQAANQIPGGNNLVAWARANDEKVWLDEWSVSEGNAAEGWPGGGDNPFFIQEMNDWIRANLDVVVGETTYNDPGAPSYLNHVLYPRTAGNPNASDKYRALWGR